MFGDFAFVKRYSRYKWI